MGNRGISFPGNFAIWREILVSKIKKYIRNGGNFGDTEGKFWSVFPGNVAFFPAVRVWSNFQNSGVCFIGSIITPKM